MLGRASRLDALERMPVALGIDLLRRIRRRLPADPPRDLATAAEDGPQSLLAVLLGLDGGLRRGEILGIRWDDVNLDRLEMTIRATIVGGELGKITKSRSQNPVHASAILSAISDDARRQRAR